MSATKSHWHFNLGSPGIQIPAARHQQPFIIEYEGTIELCQFFECSAKVIISYSPDMGRMTRNRIENEWPGTREDLFCISKCKQRSDSPAFAAFPSNLDSEPKYELADSWRRTAKI